MCAASVLTGVLGAALSHLSAVINRELPDALRRPVDRLALTGPQVPATE
jgi:hypothetical protein